MLTKLRAALNGQKLPEAGAPTAPKNWRVVGTSADGKKISTQVKAISRSRARQMAMEQGIKVTTIGEYNGILSVEFGEKVTGAVLLQVTRQLSAFTSAGIPILQALQLLSESTKSKMMASTLESMVDDVRDGATLAKAAGEHKAVFPEYYVAILGAAERTGDLSGTFDTLAVYLERDLAAARAVKSAMYYPAVLSLLGVTAIIVLSTVVLPKFNTFFTSLDTELPPATATLLAVTNFVGAYWPAIVAVIVLSVVGVNAWRRTDGGRLATDSFMLKLPVFGSIFQLVALERFCRILGSLNDTGVPLTDALKLSSEVMGNRAYQIAVEKTRDGVIAGRGLAEPLADTKMFPQEAVQIFRVGEQSGLLTQQLKHAAVFYTGEVDYKLKNLTALIEPIVLLVIGGGTGFVAVALVSAMYGIYSSQSLGG